MWLFLVLCIRHIRRIGAKCAARDFSCEREGCVARAGAAVPPHGGVAALAACSAYFFFFMDCIESLSSRMNAAAITGMLQSTIVPVRSIISLFLH